MELKAYIKILLRRWFIALPIILITLGATTWYTLQQPITYSAKATYVARLDSRSMNDQDVASALDILSRRAEIATTYSEVAKSRRIKNFAASQIGLSQSERQSMSVNSRVIAGTNLLEISTVGGDPEMVSEFTNAIGEATIAYVRDLYEAYELVSLDDAVTPGAPARRPLVNIFLGGLAGLVLGLGVAFLSEYLSSPEAQTRKERATEEFEEEPFEGGYYAPVGFYRELATLQAQFETARKQMEQTQTALSSTQQEAEAIKTVVHDLTTVLEQVRTELADRDGRKNGAKV
jgi:capsular polysaccharide biosynthesis protein